MKRQCNQAGKENVSIYLTLKLENNFFSTERSGTERRVETKKSAGLCEGEGNCERAAETGGRKEEKLPHVIIQRNLGLSSLLTMYYLCLLVQTRLYLHSVAK